MQEFHEIEIGRFDRFIQIEFILPFLEVVVAEENISLCPLQAGAEHSSGRCKFHDLMQRGRCKDAICLP